MKKKKLSLLLLSLPLMISFLFGDNASNASAVAADGGCIKSTYIAGGGRVDIEYHDLYMNVDDARTYVSKAEMSIVESIG